MEILQLIWELGEASVAEVQARILKHRKVAYTTVMTIMKNLADKGYLAYRKEGSSYIYRPGRPEHEVKSSLLQAMLTKVFKGSPAELVQTLVSHEELSEGDRRALITLIQSMK